MTSVSGVLVATVVQVAALDLRHAVRHEVRARPAVTVEHAAQWLPVVRPDQDRMAGSTVVRGLTEGAARVDVPNS